MTDDNPHPVEVFAIAVAHAAGGTVRVFPCDQPAWVVVMPGPTVPVLIRDHGHTVSVSIRNTATFSQPIAEIHAAIPAIAASASAWAKAHAADVSLVELALDMMDTLSSEFGEHWKSSIPGTPDPSEIWLHGKDDASVGVFDQKVVVWVDGKMRASSVRNRYQLQSVREKVIAAVRDQHAAGVASSELGDEVFRMAGQLVAFLGLSRVAPQGTYRTGRRNGLECTVVWNNGGTDQELARLRGFHTKQGGRIEIEAGVEGPLGWKKSFGVLTAPDADEIAAAYIVELQTLTLDKLVESRRYLVLEDIGELKKGMQVRFNRFVDFDNHHNAYEFLDDHDNPYSVWGDYSSKRHGELAATYRYLREIS